MENWGYLVAAYSIIWVVLSIYIFTIYRRQRQLRRDIDSLKKKLNGD
jgi:CcmD family protein